MSTTRRTFIQRALAMTVLPASLQAAGCGDDTGAEPRPDTGLDPDTSPDTDPDGSDGPDPEWVDDLPQYNWEGPPGPEDIFSHGLASGDPTMEAVILWTRVSTANGEQTEVWYEISENLGFTQRVDAGFFQTDGDIDHTVKVDVEGLQAGRTYYYRFFCQGRQSVVGRTRTASAVGAERARFVVCSCSSLAHGYFHAYEKMAQRNDIDAVIHLGDYIYEYGTAEYGNVRPYEPAHEILTLTDYRTRYAQYRRDPQLQAAHRQHPFIAIWDDHETADNSWSDGAGNHTEGVEGAWSDRKSAAVQTYNEWMPIRAGEPELRIYRTLKYGDLLDLILLDTRLWGRDEQGGLGDRLVHTDPTRSLLGADQEAWLDDQMRTSTARWRVLGQQVMVGNYKGSGLPDSQGGGSILNSDQWDGYQGARNRLFDSIRSGERNVVILTGDIHSSWAHDIAPDPNNLESYNPATGEGSIAVEYVVPAITSPGFPELVGPGLANAAKGNNPTLKWAELTKRGYLLLDVSRERVQGAWYHLDSILDPLTATESFTAAWSTDYGAGRLREDPIPSTAIADRPDLVS